MKTHSMQFRSARIALIILMLGVSATAANAQTAAPAKHAAATHTAENASPSNAQLQQEIEALREEIRQLKQAQFGAPVHGPAAGKTKGAGASKQGMGMPAMSSGNDKDMQHGDMEMMKGKGMGKKEDPKNMNHSMKKPPTEPAEPPSMSDDMTPL